ncbi:hypothetical protein PENSPDRAFT_758923 [Peniophora sp. CONT]|nr:hypothetical protein PENSPDRAFT_758923 [Peniophora sp. CONT]
MSRSIHARHAENWGLPSPWAAEWMFNIFKHCSTPEGNAAYRAWMRNEYGEEDGNDRMRKCKEPGPPRRISELSKEERMLFRAAMDLSSVTGIHCYPLELGLYHEFCNATRTALPPQKKDAISRRKGETAEDWLFRRNEGIVQGRRVPEMDWQLCRAIAISELDRVRDDYAAMRADIQLFTDRILTRRESIIPSPEVVKIGENAPDYLWIRTSEDAWRAITNLQHLAHSAWSQAASLFEDLAEQGITTPRSLERAYKKDVDLVWRLLRTFTAVVELDRQMNGHVDQTVTWSEYYRPWFKRYRSQDGRSHIEVDKDAVKARPPADELDEAVLKCCINGPNDSPMILFWTQLKLATKRDAKGVGQRFSAAAYEMLGDYSVVQEFFVNVYDSPWGRTFHAHASSVLSASSNAQILSRLSFMQLGAESPTPVRPRYKYGRASSVSDDQCDRWIDARQGDAIYFGPEFGDGSFTLTNFWTKNPALFDPLLLRIDTKLWGLAHKLDRPGQAGAVARLYGLLDPKDPNRLTFAKRREKKLLEQSPPQTTPAPAASLYESSIPIAIPGVKDEAAVSGHQYTAEAESEGAVKSKKKKKKKGKTTGNEPDADASVDGITSSLEKTRVVQETAPPAAEQQPQTVNLDDVPNTLPSKFVLPRKMAKIIHRLLDGRYDDDFDKQDADAPAKGEVRWQDFEKVMRRIGFQVVQTAGSSVRFDPPAKTARPISFHRPHPDAVIPPIMAKWYGARLSRVYGWTMSTFEIKAGVDKEDMVE